MIANEAIEDVKQVAEGALNAVIPSANAKEVSKTATSIYVKNNNKDLGYGVRNDPTQGDKGDGFIAGKHTVTRDNGEEVQVTEYTVGVEIDGKIVDVPSINAYTTEEDMKAILESVRTGKPLPQEIEEKAQRHALDRIDAGKSIYLEKGEKQLGVVFSNEKIVKDWAILYQTTNDPIKNKRAAEALNKKYTVPPKAKNSIEIAASIFKGDKGYTKEQLIQFGSAIGQIESAYITKIQKLEGGGEGKARSYWQVEPDTALSLLKNSSAIFGKEFRKAFNKKYKKGSVSAVKYLSKLTEDEMSDLLLKDSDLAATFAIGVIVNRTEKGK